MQEKEKLIETSFLIPLHEDKDIGNGRLHPATRWMYFQRRLFNCFAGWTLAPGIYKGSYRDPKTGLEVTDLSRKYILAVPKNDLSKLRIFLKKEGAIFRQKFIYFEVAGKVELLEVEYEQSL